MKKIWLEPDDEQEAEILRGKSVDPSNVRRTLKKRDTEVVGPDGKTVALYFHDVIRARLDNSDEILKHAYKILKNVDGFPRTRHIACGTLQLPQRKKDGVWSRYVSVNERVEAVLKKQGVRIGTLGYRKGRFTPMSIKHPEMLEAVRPLAELTNQLYAEQLPGAHARQLAIVEASGCQLHKTAFSTAYVTKNWQINYHRDGNLPGGMTCITTLGKYTGGELIILRWGIAIPYQPGDILIFNAEDLHAILPFKGNRLSVAFFCGGWVTKFRK